MKVSHYFFLLVTVIVGVAGLMMLSHQLTAEREREARKASLDLRKAEERFEFHYAGKEKWTNVFAVYRFDKRSGDVIRFAYTVIEAEKEKGTPQFDEVETLNLGTGECSRAVSSENRK